MLLKQPRTTNAKFSKGSSQQREAKNLRMEQVKGTYVPKERRMAKKLEINTAHFQLGSEIGMPKVSYGQDLIMQCVEKTTNNSNTMAKDIAERKHMVELSRQSNFHIGEEAKIKSEVYAQETSSKIAY